MLAKLVAVEQELEENSFEDELAKAVEAMETVEESTTTEKLNVGLNDEDFLALADALNDDWGSFDKFI